MGIELDLSELAVIRSIRTAANRSADGAAPTLQPAGRKGEDDDVGTGCVTPTAAAAVSPMPAGPRSGVVVDVDVAGCDVSAPTPISAFDVLARGGVDEDDDTGCVTPTAATGGPMTPRRGATVFVVVDAVFATPTSAASVLRSSTECPPAPRKPARSPVVPKRKRPGGAPRPCFFPVPRDLTKVFVARGPEDSSPRPQAAAKKIRVHPVG